MIIFCEFDHDQWLADGISWMHDVKSKLIHMSSSEAIVIDRGLRSPDLEKISSVGFRVFNSEMSLVDCFSSILDEKSCFVYVKKPQMFSSIQATEELCLLEEEAKPDYSLISLIPNLEVRGKIYRKMEEQRSIYPGFVSGNSKAWHYFLKFWKFCLHTKIVADHEGGEMPLILNLWKLYFAELVCLRKKNGFVINA